MNSCPIFNYPPVAVMFMVTAPIRGRARMSFFLSLHLRFVGGWGGGVGDVNVHGTCTLT